MYQALHAQRTELAEHSYNYSEESARTPCVWVWLFSLLRRLLLFVNRKVEQLFFFSGMFFGRRREIRTLNHILMKFRQNTENTCWTWTCGTHISENLNKNKNRRNWNSGWVEFRVADTVKNRINIIAFNYIIGRIGNEWPFRRRTCTVSQSRSTREYHIIMFLYLSLFYWTCFTEYCAVELVRSFVACWLCQRIDRCASNSFHTTYSISSFFFSSYFIHAVVAFCVSHEHHSHDARTQCSFSC